VDSETLSHFRAAKCCIGRTHSTGIFQQLVFVNLVKERTMFEGLFQPMHLLVIFGIALLVFGPKKLPELGKGIGEGIRGFKSAINAGEERPATAMSAGNDRGHE
jgi:sec-independent protein translocase protein TatA